jgi:UDP-glucose 4-epimerase
MKFLVTGRAGYVKSILAPGLPGNHHEIIIIDNSMYSEQSSINCDYNNLVCDDASNR